MKTHLLYIALLGAASTLAFSSCSNDENNSATDGDIRIGAKLADGEGDAPEAGWNHTLFLYSGDNLVKIERSANASFLAKPGEYSLKALVIENKTNLEIPAEQNGVNDLLKVKATNDPIPNILYGSSASTQITGTQSIPVTVTRLNSKVNFNLEAPQSIKLVAVTISDLNDQITLDGTASASASGLTKTITLTRDGAKFVGSAILLPSEATAFNLTYEVYFESGGSTTKTATPSVTGGGAILVPNQETAIEGTISISGGGSDVDVTALLSYAAWQPGETINDNIHVTVPDEPADDTWSVTANANALDGGGEASLANLIDGNLETLWSSDHWNSGEAGYPKTVTIDMKSSKTVNKVTLTRGATTFYYFQVHVSDVIPEVSAIPADSDSNNLGYEGYPTMEVPAASFANGGNATGRYVTIVLNKHGNGWGSECDLAEIEVEVAQ